MTAVCFRRMGERRSLATTTGTQHNPLAEGDVKRGQGHVTLPATLRTGLLVTAQVAVLVVAGWLVTPRTLDCELPKTSSALKS